MRKLIILLFLLLFLVVPVAQADQYKVEGGKVLSAPSVWKDTGVKVTPEAEKYPDASVRALGSGKPVEVAKKTVVTEGKMVDLFHHKLNTTVSHLSVVYHAEKGTIDTMNEEIVTSSEAVFNPYLILWLMAVGVMFALGRTKNFNATFISAAVTIDTIILAFGGAVVIANVATAFVVFAATVAFTTTAVVLALLAILAILELNKKMYKLFSRIFYLLMAISAGFMYFPLIF